MFQLLSVIFIIICFVSSAKCDDNIFTSTNVIRAEVRRLGSEAIQVATTPADIEGYGFFGTLATAGAVGLTYVYDSDIRAKIQLNKSHSLDRATDAGAVLGNPFLHLGVAAAVYGGGIVATSPKYRELGEMMGESLLLADVSTLLLKESIGRARPFTSGDKGNFRPFQLQSDYDSLPSMHTASSFALASVLAATAESPLVKTTYYAAASFVAYSRLYQDKHWASDVVLGAIIGELCGRVVLAAHAGNKEQRLVVTPAVTGDTASVLVVGHW